jgi:hypothetical protein
MIRLALMTLGLASIRRLALKSQGPVELQRGTTLNIELSVEGLVVAPAMKTLLWKGRVGNALFLVDVPRGASHGSRKCVAFIRVHETEIARIDFVLTVGTRSGRAQRVDATIARHKSAFASYASPDRQLVISRVQGIKKVAPNLDVFIDVDSLRSGTYWEQEIERRIPESDVFYLFWSRRARQSVWVEKEWRLAYSAKGLDFIDPVPLESPELAPPPPELAAKNFREPLLAHSTPG